MKPEPDQLESAFVDTLNQILYSTSTEEFYSNKLFLPKLKKALHSYAESIGCQLSGGGFGEEYETERLYGLLLYSRDIVSRLQSVELVLETELTTGVASIRYPFEKLLLANARHRILVCRGWKLDPKDVIAYCNAAFKAHKHLQLADRLLVIFADDSLEEVTYKLFVKNSNSTELIRNRLVEIAIATNAGLEQGRLEEVASLRDEQKALALRLAALGELFRF